MGDKKERAERNARVGRVTKIITDAISAEFGATIEGDHELVTDIITGAVLVPWRLLKSHWGHAEAKRTFQMFIDSQKEPAP